MGELARKPGAPTLAETPLELLTPRPGEGFSFMDRYGALIALSAIGFGTPCCVNSVLRRPYWAGIHIHILMGISCFYLGKFIQDRRLENHAEENAVLKHYISLHPEDFPPFERQRIGDVFTRWYPVR